VTEQIDQDKVEATLGSYLSKYRSSTKWWSACLYSCLFGAAVLSALAGVIPQIHAAGTKDWASGLALTAALITTINGIGRFDQKWQASRLARAHTEALQVQLLGGVSPAKVCAQLEQIIVEQSLEVVGVRQADADDSQTDPASGKPRR
jgi:hypothetical protein